MNQWPTAAEVEAEIRGADLIGFASHHTVKMALQSLVSILRSMEQAGTPMTNALVEQQERSLPKAYNDLIDHARNLERLLAVAHPQAYKDAALIAELEQRLGEIREQTIGELAKLAIDTTSDDPQPGSWSDACEHLCKTFRDLALKEKKA